MPWRPRTPISGGTRPGWPTSPPWWPPRSGCTDEQIEAVRTGGRLHDIGKIGIREEILNKQGPLTEEEYEHVKQHVTVGSQILAPLVHLGDVIGFVRSHHERWDGTGYPDRLEGEAIPLGARIIGAVEIYDALTTARPYQEKMHPEVGGGTDAGPGRDRDRSRGASRRSRLWCRSARRSSSWTTPASDYPAMFPPRPTPVGIPDPRRDRG